MIRNMPAFRVRLNGKKVSVAGIDGDGVLSANVVWVRRKGARVAQEFALDVSGLRSATGDHVVWQEALPLKIGDEVCVEVIDAARLDNPTRTKKHDAAAEERSRRHYVRRMAKQFGWKIVMPK